MSLGSALFLPFPQTQCLPDAQIDNSRQDFLHEFLVGVISMSFTLFPIHFSITSLLFLTGHFSLFILFLHHLRTCDAYGAKSKFLSLECVALRTKSGCTLESSGALQNPVAQDTSTPIKSELLGMGSRHQYFKNLPGRFQGAVKIEKHRNKPTDSQLEPAS